MDGNVIGFPGEPFITCGPLIADDFGVQDHISFIWITVFMEPGYIDFVSVYGCAVPCRVLGRLINLSLLSPPRIGIVHTVPDFSVKPGVAVRVGQMKIPLRVYGQLGAPDFHTRQIRVPRTHPLSVAGDVIVEISAFSLRTSRVLCPDDKDDSILVDSDRRFMCIGLGEGNVLPGKNVQGKKRKNG